MGNDDITIEVDGKKFLAKRGQMLIEVTDDNDIYVPRFCYHNKLTIAANCRMCLVEVEKAPKPLPACATPVMDGMIVRTQSAKAIDAQKSIMEFLLINHPLDCPICDQGGECELQDLAMGYGRDVSRYQEKKRVVKDKNIGPLIQTDLTRCIHCTRCVRFGEEIAGLRELGATGRGENMEIGTYIEKSVSSEMSANVIDLCPVGALTSKPFRYSARTWELVQKDAVAPHDSVGSNIHMHVKGDRIKRVVPADNEAINEVWISDRDRFSYEGLYSKDRVQTPMIKENGIWSEVDWETALNEVKERLQGVINADGINDIGVIASPSSTTEELYLLQKFVRALGSNNIDSRLKQVDFSDQNDAPIFPWLGQSIAGFESNGAALLIGSYTRKDQPIINHRLRKAALKGAAVMFLNSVDYDINYPVVAKRIVSPVNMANELAAILKALTETTSKKIGDDVKKSILAVTVHDEHKRIADKLLNSEDVIVLLGNTAIAHPDFSLLRSLSGTIAELCQAKFGYLSEAANVSGAWLAGALPHRQAAAKEVASPGLNTQAMFEANLNAYLLLNVEPELDCWNSLLAQTAMQNADCVITISPYASQTTLDYANIILPVAAYAETAGTFINNAGDVQSFTGVVSPSGEARPAWKVIRVLGNCFDLNGFDQQSVLEVKEELMQLVGEINGDNQNKWSPITSIRSATQVTQRMSETPMNMIDSICRRSPSLQHTADVADGAVHINSQLAESKKLNAGDRASVTQGDASVALDVIIDDRVADDCVLIHSAHPVQIGLGGAFGEISLEKS